MREKEIKKLTDMVADFVGHIGKKLPDDVLFYPGHEYTAYGLYSLNGLPAQIYAEKAKRRLAQGLPAGPFTLGEEKVCNPYLSASNLAEFWNLVK